MIKSNIDVIVNNSCCCAQSTYRTVVLKCDMIGNDNVLTQDMIETPYTKYIIKYDYIIDPNPIVGVANIDTQKEDCCSGKTYYYWRTLISLRKGQSITIPEGCVLLNSNLTAELDIVAADKDIDVYIASETPGSYNYKIQQSLIIPEKCIIQFDGGSISNGTLVGNKTILLSFQKNENVLKNVELKGTFTNVFEIQEEVITKQPGEKIIPVYKRITLRSGREKVAFNVCSFEIQDIDRIIRFDYGGSQPYEITLSKGQNSFRFPTAEELGFDRVLEGWYTKDNDWIQDGNGEWQSSTQGEHRYNPGEEYIIPEGVEELKFYVHWLCSVTFVSQYGSVPTSQTLNLGEQVSLSPITLSEPTESDPTNPYYTTKFEGWYLDQNYTNKVLDQQYLITQNVTFYAKWNTNIVTVRFYFKYIGRFGLIKEEVIDRDKNEQVQVPTVADSIDYNLEYVKYWVYKNNPDSIAITEGQTTWSPSGEPKLIEVYAVRALNLQFNPDGGSVNQIRVTVNHNNQSKSITVGENINTEDIYVDDKLIFDAYSGTKQGYKLSENSDFYQPSTEIVFLNNELTIDEDTIEGTENGVLVISPYWVTDSITLTWKDDEGNILKQDNLIAGNIVLQNYQPTRGNFPNNNSYWYTKLNGSDIIYKRIEKEIDWITDDKAELNTAMAYVQYIVSTAYWKINGNEVDLSQSTTITGNTEIVLGFKDPEFTTNNVSVVLSTFIAPNLIIDTDSEYSFKGWMDEDNNTFDNFNSIADPSYFDNHSEVFTAQWESKMVSLTFKAPKCTYLSLGDGFGTYTLDEDNTDAEMEWVNSRKYYCPINKDLKVTVKVPKTKSDGSSTEIHLPYAYRLYKFYVHKRGEENPTVVSGYLDNLYMNQLTSWRITNIDGRSVANVQGNTLEDLGANTSVVFEQQYSIDGWNPQESYILNRLNTQTGKDGNYQGWYLENGTKLVEETTTTTIYRFVDKIKAAFNDNSNYGNNLDYSLSSSPSWSLKFHVYDYNLTASVSYALTTTIPSDFGSLDTHQIPSGEVSLSSLQGWYNWEGQNDQYILIDTVKTESGNIVTDASKYITLKDASGNPGLEDSFTCTINNNIVSLKWNPAFPGPLDNSTHGNYKIIFK